MISETEMLSDVHVPSPDRDLRSEFRDLSLVEDKQSAKDFIFGRKRDSIVVLRDDGFGRNIFVVGNEGTGKTKGFVLTNIPQCIKKGYSMVAIDRDGSVCEEMSGLLEDAGYAVKVWNAENPGETDEIKALPEKYAYFIQTDDENYDRANRFLTRIIALLEDEANNSGGHLKRSVHLFLDDFPDLGRIEGFDGKIWILEKHGISCTIITPTFDAIRKVYGYGGMLKIIDSCKYHVCTGTSDDETMSRFSEAAGKKITRLYAMNSPKTYRVVEVPTILEDEIRVMPPDQLLLLIGNTNEVLRLKKTVGRKPNNKKNTAGTTAVIYAPNAAR